jgi:putative transposase
VIRTAVRAPKMNSVAERFVGSARRELLDHVLLVDEQHLSSLLCQYARYFNESRPHQGLGQRIPADPVTVIDPSKPIAVKSVLGGLHVDYCRTA